MKRSSENEIIESIDANYENENYLLEENCYVGKKDSSYLAYKQNQFTKAYMNDIVKIPLLTTFEEKKLFQIIQEGKKCHFIKYGQYKNIEFDYIKLFSLLSNIEFNQDTFELLKELKNHLKSISAIKNLKYYIYLVEEKNSFLNALDIQKHFKESSNNDDILTEIELSKDIKRYIHYLDAKIKINEANLKLIIAEAKRIRPFSPLEEMVQEGNFGLSIAIDRFDPKKTNKFSTFATPWIKKYIFEYIYSNSNGAIPLNRSFYVRFQKIEQVRKKIQNGEDKPIDQETIRLIAKELHSKESTIADFYKYPCVTNSLDKKVSDDDNSDDATFVDFVYDETNSVEAIYEQEHLYECIENLLSYLTDIERKIICLRFGIGTEDNKTYTLNQACSIIGCSYEWVRKTEKYALLKLRHLAEYNQNIDALRDYIR